jgi:hypothetical protein
MRLANGVSARNINVTASRGVAKLTGTAATMQESNQAAQIARGVAGVKAVENDIRVQQVPNDDWDLAGSSAAVCSPNRVVSQWHDPILKRTACSEF